MEAPSPDDPPDRRADGAEGEQRGPGLVEVRDVEGDGFAPEEGHRRDRRYEMDAEPAHRGECYSGRSLRAVQAGQLQVAHVGRSGAEPCWYHPVGGRRGQLNHEGAHEREAPPGGSHQRDRSHDVGQRAPGGDAQHPPPVRVAERREARGGVREAGQEDIDSGGEAGEWQQVAERDPRR